MDERAVARAVGGKRNSVVTRRKVASSRSFSEAVREEPGTVGVGTAKGRTEMGKLVISENVTLDGVVQDPAGAEGFGRGGWVGRVGERGREEAAKVLLGEALGAEAQLFGRRTYEFLAARWPSRSGELADS
jgi:hypothetical protein